MGASTVTFAFDPETSLIRENVDTSVDVVVVMPIPAASLTDGNGTETFKYSLISVDDTDVDTANPSSIFEVMVDATDAAVTNIILRMGAEIDKEVKSSYELMVQATYDDDNGNTQTGKASLTVEVEDVNEPPILTLTDGAEVVNRAHDSVTSPEEILFAKDITFGDTDMPEAGNEAFTTNNAYSITDVTLADEPGTPIEGVSAADHFSSKATTGSISITAAGVSYINSLTALAFVVYTITLSLTDTEDPTLTASKTLTLKIFVNSSIPIRFSPASTTHDNPIEENSDLKSTTFVIPAAEGPDDITYTVKSGTNFTLGGTHGRDMRLSAAAMTTNFMFDYETHGDSYRVAIGATDDNDPANTTELIFTIPIVDVNESPTLAFVDDANPPTPEMPKNASANMLILGGTTLIFGDTDSGANLAFHSENGLEVIAVELHRSGSLLNPQPTGIEGFFTNNNLNVILAPNGATYISGADSMLNDEYKITVRNYDINVPTLEASVTFILSIVEKVEISFSRGATSIDEDIETSNRTNILSFSPADVPDDSTATFDHVLVSVNTVDVPATGHAIFGIDINTSPHQIFLKAGAAIDAETEDEYVLLIRATKQGDASKTADAMFTITVTDLNDNPPYLMNGNYLLITTPHVTATTITFDEDDNTTSFPFAAFAEVIDADKDPSNHKYTIEADTGSADVFTVITNAGQPIITLKPGIKIDFEDLPTGFNKHPDNHAATFEATFVIKDDETTSIALTDPTQQLQSFNIIMTVHNVNDEAPVFTMAPTTDTPLILFETSSTFALPSGHYFIATDPDVNAAGNGVHSNDSEDPITYKVSGSTSFFTLSLLTSKQLRVQIERGLQVATHRVTVTASDGTHTITNTNLIIQVVEAPTLRATKASTNISYKSTLTDFGGGDVFFSAADMGLELEGFVPDANLSAA